MKTQWRAWLLIWAILCGGNLLSGNAAPEPLPASGRKVYILPIRDNIEPPLVYVVRRGVKEAMEAKADLLLIDMDTNGGRVDCTEEIIGIIGQFKGRTATYVNKKAFSAGAFIAFSTEKIFMAPQSVIGAAAPIVIGEGGQAEAMPDTVEAKMSSAISALIRANAEKHGHNTEVVDAMVRKSKELVIDGKVINPKGEILTLTDVQAAKEYGQPPKPLVSAGTIETEESVLAKLGFAGGSTTRIVPTGAERMGFWINSISGLLLLIGIIGAYIEFKTPGFGLPGIVSIVAFVVYFLGGYISGYSGGIWLLVFFAGVVLIVVELFFFPGTIAIGLLGGVLVLGSLIMALVDVYPGMPLWSWPTIAQDSLERSIQIFGFSMLASVVLAVLLARFLPHTPLYGALVSQTTSGAQATVDRETKRSARLGQTGVTISPLRPAGKAQFGEEVLDVIAPGEMVEKGKTVKIVGFNGHDAVVSVVG